MQGVEAAPLTYVIAAIAVVIALSILVLMGGTVRKGVAGATETLNKSIVTGAQKVAREIGEMYGEDTVAIFYAEEGDPNPDNITVKFYIYNWKNAVKAKLYINDVLKYNETLKPSISQCSSANCLGCDSKDIDGDGMADDLECKIIYKEVNLTDSGKVKISLADVNDQEINFHAVLYPTPS